MYCECCNDVTEIIGGTRRRLTFAVYDDDGQTFPMTHYEGYFSMASAVNREMSPVVSKSMTVPDKDGNLISVVLGAKDTYDLSGKFIYQVMIVSEKDGLSDIGTQGAIVIHQNINPGLIEGWE